MARRINQEKCIRCGACIPVCPNEGITQQGDDIVIDSEYCTECYGFKDTSSCTLVCPVDAIECIPDSIDDEKAAALAVDLRPDHFPRD